MLLVRKKVDEQERAVRFSVSLPSWLKSEMEKLGKYPYGSVSNAISVLLQQALEFRASQELSTQQIISFIKEKARGQELSQIAQAVSEALQREQELGNKFLVWLSGNSGISLERLEEIRKGGELEEEELVELTRILRCTPTEVEDLLREKNGKSNRR